MIEPTLKSLAESYRVKLICRDCYARLHIVHNCRKSKCGHSSNLN